MDDDLLLCKDAFELFDADFFNSTKVILLNGHIISYFNVQESLIHIYFYTSLITY